MKTEVIGTKGIPTDFGTTRFPCGCIIGWHKVAEIAQWAPCKVHASALNLLTTLETLVYGNRNAQENWIAAHAVIHKARGE